MNRLLTFGCSNTFGHGLPDCWNKKTKKPGDSPSKYAWPKRLAKKLDLQCENLSRPGASNREIWWRVVNTDFERTDTVIILWTLLYRHCIIDSDNYLEPRHLASWGHHKESRVYSHLMKFSNDLDQEINSKQYMESTNFYLKSKNVSKIYNFGLKKQEWSTEFDWTSVEIKGYAGDVWTGDNQSYKDFALDHLHPGPISHRLLADYIHQFIER